MRVGCKGVYITQTYEGDSICNEIVQINQEVLYLYALQLHSQKDLLLGYTTAKSQLSSSFPEHCTNRFQERVLNYTAIRALTVFSNLEYCMS